MKVSKKSYFASFLSVVAVVSVSSFADRWDGYSNPEKMPGEYNYRFSTLPMRGTLDQDKLPWSDTYMPSFLGGVAFRWQTPEVSTWGYRLATLSELKSMSQNEIAKLSPAEKYDIMMGDYTYPTVMHERKRTSPKRKEWEGICHGWAPAALHHREPAPKVVTNADGVVIPFGSSDIKAMLIFYYGKVNWKPSAWLGKRCRSNILGGKGCRGINPGSLHVILANQLGVMKRGFIADVDRKREIWNQPVYAFESQVIGSISSREVLVQTTMFYGDELDESAYDPVMPVKGVTFDKKNYKYSIELDETGNIVGGEWYSKDRPGFIWQHEMVDFADPYYGKVLTLTQ